MVAPAHANKKWYTAKERAEGWQGIVYHYDPTGNKQITDHATELHNTKEQAMDAAVEWADDHNVDVEME